MVSEGALNWSIRPWLRRLVTRSISITPSIIIAGAVGKEGLDAALNGTQVALSIILPFVSAPLIYFTCRNKYMTVRAEGNSEGGEEGVEEGEGEKMRNHWFVTVFAVLIWTVIAAMNIANLVLLGKGQSGA
jgi:metal iron transporter